MIAASRPGRSGPARLAAERAADAARPPRRAASAGRASRHRSDRVRRAARPARRPAIVATGRAPRSGRGDRLGGGDWTGHRTCADGCCSYAAQRRPASVAEAARRWLPVAARRFQVARRRTPRLSRDQRWTSPHSSPRSSTSTSHSPTALTLECGATLPRLTVAYRTYGTLNAARTNAMLVCHALTGDQYVAEPTPDHRQAGLVGDWWSGPAGRSTPTAFSSSAPTCWAAAWAPPARAARARRDGAGRAMGHRFPAGHHPRHGARAEAADRPPRASRGCSR